MKIQTALRCALILCLIQNAITFGQETAQPRNGPPQNASAATYTQRQNVGEYIDLLRTDVQGQKAEIMGAMMKLGVDQSAKFWPIYSEYDAELTKLNDSRVGSTQDYARNYYQITDPKADALAQNAFSYRRQSSELLAKYYDRVKGIPARVSAATAS